MPYDLEFEKPLAELEKKIVALQNKRDRLKPEENEWLRKAEQDLPLYWLLGVSVPK
jgi:acetyl-CoA carboxylase carboxyl transferase subunit alpha